MPGKKITGLTPRFFIFHPSPTGLSDTKNQHKMNKIKWLVSAIAALSLSVAPISCSRDDEPDEPYYPYYPENPSGPGNNGGDQGGGSGDSKTMTLIPTSLKFPAAGATENVYVQNAPGTVEVSKPSWLTVTYVSQGKYQVKASANTGARRTGTVYFVSGNSNSSLAVEQEGKNDGGTGGDSGGSGTGGGSETGQKPTAPTGLTAYPDGPSSAPFANIKWNTVSGAKQYIVYRSTSANGSYSQIKTVDTYVYYDENVKYGNTYYYKVKASNSYGTSDYSDYAKCEFADRRKPGPVQYGNCTVSGTTMTLRWTVPKDPSYGTPTKALLKVMNPSSGNYAVLETLSGTATSASFSYPAWADKDGFVRAGIILENENGTGGGVPKVYDTKNKRWIN